MAGFCRALRRSLKGLTASSWSGKEFCSEGMTPSGLMNVPGAAGVMTQPFYRVSQVTLKDGLPPVAALPQKAPHAPQERLPSHPGPVCLNGQPRRPCLPRPNPGKMGPPPLGSKSLPGRLTRPSRADPGLARPGPVEFKGHRLEGRDICILFTNTRTKKVLIAPRLSSRIRGGHYSTRLWCSEGEVRFDKHRARKRIREVK